MLLTVDQILALARDTSSVAAARKLAHPRHWRNPGRSVTAVWGECQGGALYQVRADLSGAAPAVKCSCPSRKLPCKHALGLLLMIAADPGAMPDADAPSWVTEWLDARARAAQRPELQPRRTAPPDPAAQARRAEQRLERVREGIEALELWMHDLVRTGLAAVDDGGSSVWEAQAARLVDAQASALASRIRGLAFISHATPDWPDRLLSELGRIALLTHAFRRIDNLDPPLQADVRQLIGWTLKEDDVLASGETVADDWLVLGQWSDEDERFRIQRTWLSGIRTGRRAMVLQFAPGLAPFAESYTPGTHFEGGLVYWPSAYPLRAMVRERSAAPRQWNGRLPGVDDFEAFLAFAAHALGRQPWLHRLPCVILDVVPVPNADAHWSLVDRRGLALPFAGVDKWSVLALSGGQPVDVVAEWDGRTLRPLFAASASERASWSRSPQ